MVALSETELALTKTERRIYLAVQKRPRTAEQLRNAVWFDRPDGGPESRHAIYTHVYHLNRRLRACGERVVMEYPGSEYRLVKREGEPVVVSANLHRHARGKATHKSLDSWGIYPA